MGLKMDFKMLQVSHIRASVITASCHRSIYPQKPGRAAHFLRHTFLTQIGLIPAYFIAAWQILQLTQVSLRLRKKKKDSSPS